MLLINIIVLSIAPKPFIDKTKIYSSLYLDFLIFVILYIILKQAKNYLYSLTSDCKSKKIYISFKMLFIIVVERLTIWTF